MKGKRRHELQTNILADWLGHKVEKIRPAFGWILGGGVVVVLGLLAYSFFSSRSTKQMEDGWASLNRYQDEATNAITSDKTAVFQDTTKSLQKIVTDYAGTPLAMFAESALGDLHLFRGQTLMWTKRAEALESLENAVNHYRSAMEKTKDPLLQNRLRMNLGAANQWRFQLDEAKAAYQKVDGIYRPAAQEELSAIGQATDSNLFAALESHKVAPSAPDTKQSDMDFGREDERLGDRFPETSQDSLDIGAPGVQSTVPAVQSSDVTVPAGPASQPTAAE